MSSVDLSSASSARRQEGVATVGYCATIFLSAGLLFCIEPMFSKLVLPELGGSAAVWSVAMVVFQGLMLAGYVYAHLLARFVPPGYAALLHMTLMATATLSLPIAISSHFQMPPEHGVSLWVLDLFLVSIGLPCFAIAANAPLLQSWFAGTRFTTASNPYFLYRASNAGSFLVLLAYPFLIEPAFGLKAQALYWNVGYVALMAGLALCGSIALLKGGAARAAGHASQAVGWSHRLRWIALGAVPSGLLVAVTAHIATDVASAPFLWIIPLALYLLTFVLVFTEKPVVPLRAMLWLQPLTVAALAILFLFGGKASWSIALPCHLLAFFVATMICHTRLYALRPEASSLTAFYAWMSLGGVLGGIFAALLAPQIFHTVLEYPILILAALFARPGLFAHMRATAVRDGVFVLVLVLAVALPLLFLPPGTQIAYFAVAVMTLSVFLATQGRNGIRLIALAAVVLFVTNFYDPTESIVVRDRSFYGAYKIVELDDHRFRVFFHGTTEHGAERLDEGGARPSPLSYYYQGGPLSEALAAARALHGDTLHHVAIIGLGVGSLSCYSRPGEHWALYELDPLVARIATDPKLFRSVPTCTPHAAIVLGDGRLTLQKARPDLDLLVLDVFSSDAVPTHLLTREAFALYRSKLGPHGVIAFNISNKNMQLANVVAASAAANGMVTAVKTDRRPLDSPHTLRLKAEIAVVARSQADLKALKLDSDWQPAAPAPRTWTDDYSNILGAILQKVAE